MGACTLCDTRAPSRRGEGKLSSRVQTWVLHAAAVYTALVALACLVDGMRSGCLPVSNIRYHRGEYQVVALARDGLLDRAGAEVGDQIVSLNGERFPHIFAFIDALHGLPPGTRIRLEFVRGGDVLVRHVRTWSLLETGRALVISAAVAFLVAIALVVLRIQSRARGVGLFVLYCLVTAMSLACQATGVAGSDPLHRFLTFNYSFFSLMGPPLLLQLFTVFPSRGRLQRALRMLAIPAWGVCLALGLNYWLPTVWPTVHDWGFMPTLSRRLFFTYGISSILCIGLSALSMAVAGVIEPGYRVRQQARLLLVGFVLLGVGELSLNEIPLLVTGRPLVPPSLTGLVVLILPAFVGAAIVLHQAFGINLLVRRGLIEGLSTLLVGAFFVLIAVLGTWIALRWWSEAREVVVAVAAASAALLFQPARGLMQRVVDRVVYRRHEDYRRILQEISAHMSGLLESGVAMRYLKGQVQCLLAPRGLCVAFLQGAGPNVEWLSEPGHVRFDAVRPTRTAELDALAERRSALETTERERAAGVELVLPLVRSGQVLGALYLGPREDEVPYLPEDVSFLETLGNVSALVLERGGLLEEQALRQRLALVGEALSSLAHELRNPLAAVKSTVAVLRRRMRDDERGRELTAIVEREIDRLEDTATNVLTYVRPKASGSDNVSMRDLVEQTLAVIRTEFAASRVEVCASLPAEPLEVLGDRARLRQLLVNLLLNAREAQPTGGEVECRFECGPAFLELVVADRGPGFSEEASRRAFEPFFTTKRLGTGLGLVNVLRVAEEHGATVALAGRIGGGAEVRVGFPWEGA